LYFHGKVALVISHDSGDEGLTYRRRVEEYADFMGVELKIVSDRIGKQRGKDSEGRKKYTLWDVYPHADLVKGYGNAFVEAIYFRKPVLVNRYPIFRLILNQTSMAGPNYAQPSSEDENRHCYFRPSPGLYFHGKGL